MAEPLVQSGMDLSDAWGIRDTFWFQKQLYSLRLAESSVSSEHMKNTETEILKDIIQKPRFRNHPDISHVPQNISSFIEKVELLCII